MTRYVAPRDALTAGRGPAGRGRRGVRGRLREWAGRSLLLVVSTVMALFAAEGLVRWLAPQQLILIRPDVWIAHDGLGWRMAPGLDTGINTGEREVRLLTDAEGHRIGAEDPEDERWRVLALGDSFLAGLQVEYEETFAALLETALSRELDDVVRVTNTGVGAYGPSHYLLKTRLELERTRYDLVLVFLYRGNDVVEERIGHFHVTKADERPRLRWPRWRGVKELERALLQPFNNFLEERSQLFVAVRRLAWYQLMKVGLSGRSFPESELISQAGSPRWEVTGQLSEDLAAEAVGHGLEALFVLLPGIYHVDDEIGARYATGIGYDPEEVDFSQSSRLLGRELRERGLAVIDTTETLRERRLSGTKTHGEVDTHLSPAGHQAVFEVIHEPVLELLRRSVQR